MTDRDVIDLTDSFTLVDHTTLSNFVVELDDTQSETNSTDTPEEARTRNDVNDSLIEILDITNNIGRPSQNRKKPKNSKKKAEQLPKPNKVANVELDRERSPLRSEIGDCPICLERIGSRPLASTKCGHVFCYQCLIQALDLEKKCPTCRQSLRGKTSFHPLFLNNG